MNLCNYSVLTILLLSISCDDAVPAVSNLSTEDLTLLQTHQAWSSAIREGKTLKMFSYWDENAVDYFPGKPVAQGKKAIKALVKQNRSTPGFVLTSKVESAHVADSGEMGYTNGVFTITTDENGGNPSTKAGYFMCIWHQTSGVWKCVRSMCTLEQ